MASLELPISLESALDLTPSLILAIFESMLRSRLSISSETRKSRTRPARIEAMKIFLGVLGDDVLGVEAGLGNLDPMRLADGFPEETCRVAGILC